MVGSHALCVSMTSAGTHAQSDSGRGKISLLLDTESERYQGYSTASLARMIPSTLLRQRSTAEVPCH